MKYLKEYNFYIVSILESSIKYKNVDFIIKYEELQDILSDIVDEFPNLDWYTFDSHHSSLISEDENSFIIEIMDKEYSIFDSPIITYIEPKIFQIIENIDSQLKEYDLYVSNADFGFSDATYELVISKIGTEPNNK